MNVEHGEKIFLFLGENIRAASRYSLDHFVLPDVKTFSLPLRFPPQSLLYSLSYCRRSYIFVLLAPTVSSVPLSFPPLFLTLPVYTIFHLFLTTGAIELFSRNMGCFWNTIFFRFTLKIISTWGGRVGTAGFFSEIFLGFCIQLRADIVSPCSCFFRVC